MSGAVKAVAASLRDLFMETVEKTAGMPFQDTGVTVPDSAVWEAKAARAIDTFLHFAETDAETAEICESAWLKYVRGYDYAPEQA